MATIITTGKKNKLARLGRQTRWAPFWIIPKIHGPGEQVHPGTHTNYKRTWRRGRAKVTTFKKNLWRN